MATESHILFNLRWRLQAVQGSLESLAVEIDKLLAEVASKREQEGRNGNA